MSEPRRYGDGRSGACRRAGAAAVALAVAALAGTPARAAERPEFNRDVRPILAENCFA